MRGNLRVGELEVSDRGIEQVVKVDENGYYSKVIIPKEIFIEAYKRFIEPHKEDR